VVASETTSAKTSLALGRSMKKKSRMSSAPSG
jgi:hypothetical protein